MPAARASLCRFALLTALITSPSLLPAHAQATDLARIQGTGKLRIGFSTNTPGLIEEQGGKITGFATEFMESVAREIKVKNVVWQKVGTPDALVKSLRDGKLDAIFDVKLPLQLTEVGRTAPFTCTGGVLLSRPGGPEFEEDIQGKRLAVATNSPYFYYVRNLPFDKKINVFANSDQALLGFLGGSVDALVLDRFDALKMYNRVGASKLQISPLLWNQYLQLVTPGSARRDSALEAAMNLAFTKLRDNGTYARLSKKYFAQDVRCDGWR